MSKGWGDSGFLLLGSLSVLVVIGLFFASVSIEVTSTKGYSMNLESDNSDFYDLCINNNGEWAKYGNCKFNSEVDLKSAQIEYAKKDFHWIEGEPAEKICEIVDIPCPMNVKFKSYVDPVDGMFEYHFVSKTQDYDFQMKENLLSYRGMDLIDGKWISMKQWEDVKLSEITDQSESLEGGYSVFFEFAGDELGNYLEWCIENNGLWTKENLGNVICEYVTPEDHKTARHSLDDLVNVSITGKASDDLCEFLQLDFCDEEVHFSAKFDMRTGDVIFRDSVDGKHYEIRVRGDTIQFRPDAFENQNSFSWVNFRPE